MSNAGWLLIAIIFILILMGKSGEDSKKDNTK